MITTTAELIASIESNNNQYACRYEPAWKYLTPELIQQCMIAHSCNKTTARVILSTSWGKYQIMGQVIYELMGACNIFDRFLNDIIFQGRAFVAFLSSRKIVYNVDHLCQKHYREEFARKYNGDVNTYSARIITALRENGYEVELH